MNRPFPLIWLALFLLLVVPTTAGRFFLDVAGGLMIIFFTLPILLTGLGWIGWKVLESRMNNCNTCGATFFNDVIQCPICGGMDFTKRNGKKSESKDSDSIPASTATIDVVAEVTDSEN